MLGHLLNFGRHTLTRDIDSVGLGGNDWSAVYRLFECSRIDIIELFGVIMKELEMQLEKTDPVLAFIDDTLLKKRGKKVFGTSWKLDPLGPKFSNNFIWAQRYMQISLAYKEPEGRCRAIPVSFRHCPVPKKPGRKATEAEINEYKELQKVHRLPVRAHEEILSLRSSIESNRRLIIIGDGGYTNSSVCKKLPPDTDYIGRMRKNALLFEVPILQNEGRGRKKFYGKQLPTPEELRQYNIADWQEISAATGNGYHNFKIKSYAAVRSKIAGEQNLKLIIIQPLRYRLTARSRLLYRDPAYIICTNPNIPDKDILQYYLWRWEIEINFKDEKTSFGIHEAHVRTAEAVESLPAFIAAMYSLFLLSCKKTFGDLNPATYPKWRKPETIFRPSTSSFISSFRMEVLSGSITNKSAFATPLTFAQNPFLFQNLLSSLIQATLN